MASEEDLLRSIDAKIGAILTLTLDRYLRETGIARPKERSVDKMLTDVGLSAAAIAALLGKTTQAVYQQLGNEQKKRKKAA